jgi:hypothetical protein
MPFKSKAQQKACYARKGRGQAKGWDCDEWSEETNFKRLPEKKGAAAGFVEKLAYAAAIVTIGRHAGR